MMNFKNIFFQWALVFLLISCGSAVQPAALSSAEVKAMVLDPETTLIDVRIPEQFQQKTAQGAINIPLADLEENADMLRSKKQIIVFCNTGRQAQEATNLLRKKGISKVYTAKSLQNIEAIKNEKK